jgi:predicted TIM-barrel fold metal-dependent hydrolase
MMPRYDGPVVDAHHHFWDPTINDHPWLRPEVLIPFRYGDYSSIKRPYLPDDYRRDAVGHNVVQTVYVETEWNPDDPVGEVRYASSLAKRFGWPNAIVAQAWLNRADWADVLKAYADFPLVKSVRHKPGGPTSPAEVGHSKTLMSDPVWRRGYALLGRAGLNFDLQTPWWNLPEAVELARDFPGTTIVINHTALPAQRDPENLAAWRKAMAQLAQCPNVAVKVSGISMPGQPWLSESTAWIVKTVVELFGAERSAYGSNFPVDSVCSSYDEILGGFKTILQDLPPAEQAAFFAETARRVYRLGAAA